MPLETGDFIPELDPNNPLGSDNVSLGDDHIRLLKRCTQGSFGAFVGTAAAPKSVTLTEDQINDAALKSAAQVITGAWDVQSGSSGFTISSTGGTRGLKQSHPGGDDFLSEWTGTLNWIMSGLSTVTASGAWTFPGPTLFASHNDNLTALVVSRFATDGATGQGVRIYSDAGVNAFRGKSDPANAKTVVINSSTNDAEDVPSGGQNSIAFQIRGVTQAEILDTVFSSVLPIRLNNNIALQGQNLAGNARAIGQITAADELQFGDTLSPINLRSSGNINFRGAGNLETARATATDSGGLLVVDRSLVLKKTGFRNPTRSFHTADFALLQNREGQWVEFSGTGPFTCTVNSLEEFTTMTVSNISSNDLLIAEGTAGLQWYDGAGAGTQTGDRTLSPGSVCELYWRSATFAAIYGNGLS